MIGYGELIIILVIILILFGPKRLPQLAEAVGKSMKSFKNAMADNKEENKPKKKKVKVR